MDAAQQCAVAAEARGLMWVGQIQARARRPRHGEHLSPCGRKVAVGGALVALAVSERLDSSLRSE